MKILAFVLSLAVLAIISTVGWCAGMEETLLWQIGTNDNSHAEFAISCDCGAYTRTFPNGVKIDISGGADTKAWPFILPGPVDAWAGSKQHRQEINFNLDEDPHDTYILKLDLADAHGFIPPTFEVRINGKVQSFDTDHGVGDVSLSNPTSGREQVITMYADARFLRKGANTVTISSVSGSWLLYDCITFSRTSTPPEPVQNISLAPSYLFKGKESDLKQIVIASVDLYDDLDTVKAEITSEKGWKAEQTFTNLTSGRKYLEIEVPEVKSEEKVTLKLFAANRTFESETTITPQKKWRIYMMPSTHFDLGYTGRQGRVLELHRNNLDKAMDWCRTHPDFVWNLEGSYLAMDYLQNGKRKDEFIELARKGNIGPQGFIGSELTGICSGESLVRLVDYYSFLRRKYGIESGCAMQTDVPSMVGTVPMVLAGHGIKYLSHGINLARGGHGQVMWETPYYWQSPDGSRVLMWKTYGYGHCSTITGAGDGGSLKTAVGKVNELLQKYAARQDYPYDAVLLHGAYSDNQPNGSALANIVAEWNKSYTYPKLIFTTGPDFFEHIEKNFAREIKTVTGDGGVYWEDGAASSAFETAQNRLAKETLITAEKLTSFCDEAFQKKNTELISGAWKNVLLYDEHTWGAAQSIDAPESKETKEQWEVKKAFADRAAELSGQALDQVLDRFCSKLQVQGPSVVAFNPSSWYRSEWVNVKGPDGRTLNVYAKDVPPLGYKVFSVPVSIAQRPGPIQDGVLENIFYKISFDKSTGAVTSIFDKELNRELIDPAKYGANQYLYVTGQTKSLISWGDVTETPLKIETVTGAVLSKRLLPGIQVMTATAKAPMASSLTTEVILYDDQKRIDFVNRIDKTANLAKEAGYFAFPFAFTNPEIRLEIPNGVIRPDADQFPGACRDWYGVHQFVAVSDKDASVVWTPIDSPLITLQDINRGQWYQKLDIKNGDIFAYVFNNYWFTNYKASQDGLHTFRFAMTSGRPMDDLQAKQFGESVQSPMIARFINGKGPGKEASAESLIKLQGKGIIIQAVKPARFANGTVIRLREMSGKTSTAGLVPNGITFKRAYLCNLAEDKIKELPVIKGEVKVECKALGLAAVLLER